MLSPSLVLPTDEGILLEYQVAVYV